MLGLGLSLTSVAVRGGGGVAPVSYEPESNAIFAAFTTPPDTTRKGLIDAFVVALKSAGVWSKIDGLYVYAAADSQAALINWRNPGTYDATAVNSPTFTADRGFTGNGTSMYIDSVFNPSTAVGAGYSQNSAFIAVRCLTDTRVNASAVVGFPTGGAATSLNPWNSSIDTASHSLNISASQNSLLSPGSAAGFFCLSRTGSANYDLYRNAVNLGTQNTASTGVPNKAFRGLSGTSGSLDQYTNRQIALKAVGGGLTAQEVANFYAAELAYMQGVGAA